MRLALLFACFLCSTAEAAEPQKLFNGKDLSGWLPILDREGADPAKTWSVENGILKCTGEPRGYIRTERDDFKNYHLKVEWRWPEGTRENANNGVLVHTTTPAALGIWPKSLEVQLANQNAGDFWVIPGDDAEDPTLIDVPLKGVAGFGDRIRGRRHLNFTEGSEKPVGEWNTIEVVCRGDRVTVVVNGEVVNDATNCSISSGAIALQSEGAPIEYREVVLTPLD